MSSHMKKMNEPFLLIPYPKDYLWGGNNLNEKYQKGISVFPFAEAWECSTHKDGPSVIGSGEYEGVNLDIFIQEHPEVLGEHPTRKFEDTLPVLIKLIDAKEDLSIQVHPTDEYAYEYENKQLGKTELWYVLDAEEGATIVFGFKHDLDQATLKKSIEDKSIAKYLQYVPVKKNDVFFIEPGTVHAIGKGVMIAEIQESSNLTYRLFDYDRIDKDGKKRELHLEKALDVLNLSSSASPKQPLRVLKYKRGWAEELLGRCEYFQVERILLNTSELEEGITYQTESNSYQVLLCIEGTCTIRFENHMIKLEPGKTVFIPANSTPLNITGNAQLLRICS